VSSRSRIGTRPGAPTPRSSWQSSRGAVHRAVLGRAAPHIAGIERGAVVQIIAEIGQYNGRRQLKVGSLRMLSGGAVDWRALVPAVGDVAPYWDTLDRWRSEIRGHGSREHREPLGAAGRPASRHRKAPGLRLAGDLRGHRVRRAPRSCRARHADARPARALREPRAVHRPRARHPAAPHRVASRQAGVRRAGTADDARGRGPALRR